MPYYAHNFCIGKDVALIGFDGLSTLEYTSPAISTVSQNFIEIGRKSVEVLEKIFYNRSYEKITYIPYEIICRESMTTA
ncbi:MAG: substrate-binding domain-containing protein [Cellulosilyticaceae bacterium]